MDLFVAEYSLIQEAFNVEPLSSCINRNIRNITSGTNTGFQIIGIGSYEQCSKICREFEKNFNRPMYKKKKKKYGGIYFKNIPFFFIKSLTKDNNFAIMFSR